MQLCFADLEGGARGAVESSHQAEDDPGGAGQGGFGAAQNARFLCVSSSAEDNQPATDECMQLVQSTWGLKERRKLPRIMMKNGGWYDNTTCTLIGTRASG